MSWLTSLFSFISAPIADLSGSYRERKRIAAEMAASIATAEGNLKLAKLDAEAKRLANQEGNDADYDLQVLKNRRESIMDEIIITVFWVCSLPTLYHSCSRIWQMGGKPWATKARPGILNL